MSAHAQFHKETAQIAEVANRGDLAEVAKLIGTGSNFARATQATVMALRSLDTEIRQSASSANVAITASVAREYSPPQQNEGNRIAHASSANEEWETF